LMISSLSWRDSTTDPENALTSIRRNKYSSIIHPLLHLVVESRYPNKHVGWLKEGRLVVLLDGLDEVPGNTIRNKIDAFANDPNGRNCRIVVA